MVKLGQNGAAQPDEALQKAQNAAATFREVFDASNESPCVSERLRISSDTNVETHMPDLGLWDPASYSHPNHGIAEEIHDRADQENDPRRRDLVD